MAPVTLNFVSLKLLEFAWNLLAGGAGPVLVCAASNSPARAAPWQMPLGTAVKQTDRDHNNKGKVRSRIMFLVWCSASRHEWTGHWWVSVLSAYPWLCSTDATAREAARSTDPSHRSKSKVSPFFPSPKTHRVTGHTQMQIKLLRQWCKRCLSHHFSLLLFPEKYER